MHISCASSFHLDLCPEKKQHVEEGKFIVLYHLIQSIVPYGCVKEYVSEVVIERKNNNILAQKLIIQILQLSKSYDFDNYGAFTN